MTEFKKYLESERGRGVRLASDLNVSSAAISQWAEGQVPAERIFKVSEITGIPLEQLRPDLFPKPAEAGEAA